MLLLNCALKPRHAAATALRAAAAPCCCSAQFGLAELYLCSPIRLAELHLMPPDPAWEELYAPQLLPCPCTHSVADAIVPLQPGFRVCSAPAGMQPFYLLHTRRHTIIVLLRTRAEQM